MIRLKHGRHIFTDGTKHLTKVPVKAGETIKEDTFITFEDGKIVCYDAKTLLKKKVFEPLKDINFFMNACTILNGTLAWDVTGTRDCSKCLDIDPEMLYGLENVSEKIA